ncbi:NADPH:quinone oxidoreductase family protein [Silicimonas sp. MF1-12-2]|uniref:NADPH:quinone oxidoreductase family protein n=1 Tax=Silicimonas sp. MF1-12-2 TaxID=3384793 RepID=UPI0039B48B6C
MRKAEAWICRTTNTAPRIEAFVVPTLTSNEVLLRVKAVGLNFADILMLKGSYQATPPTPFVLGMEFAGVVEEVGDAVSAFAVGDRVMGVPGHGGLAEFAVLPETKLRHCPPTMDDISAAGFQIAYGTSHLALTHRARLLAGETLLVIGAAGGVGLTAVEVGHQLGARVIAVARGKEKLEIAKAAGADVLIDSESADLLSELRSLGPIDVVYDAVGGELGETALRVMAPDGRFLVIGFASGRLPQLKPNHLLVKNQSVIGFYWGGYDAFNPTVLNTSLAELSLWHAEGRIKPHVSHVLPFERALEGLELLRSRKSSGKIVITR